ncbi:peptidase [Halobellus ordinarius]|uniref:peptidase n=1 Tax=Halobellus ordinarius TaxID=3075120 RepID=UPI0028808331|nr:peptidase [Halobellus sp. ZY16]
MAALQTTPPSVSAAIAALVGIAIAGGLLGAIGSVVVRRLRNPVGKYRLLYAAVLFPYTLLAYAVFALTGVGAAFLTALPAAPDLVTGILTDFVTFLAAGSVWIISYLPTVRGIRDVRDVDLATGTSIWKMTRYVIGLSALLSVVLIPLQVGSIESSPLALAIGLAALVLGMLYAAPWLITVLRSTSTPTGGTADRVERLCDRASLNVRDVRILDTESEETANTLVRGPPNYRRLFVTSTFLDTFDDETATALLAIEAGQLRTHVFEVRVGTVLVAGISLIASVIGIGPRWPLLGLALGVILVGFWLVRRRVRAADEYAADQVGRMATADALTEYADLHSLEPTRRRFPNPLSIKVAFGDRIDRLRTANNL